MGVPNQKAHKVMNFQSRAGRGWLLKVNVVQNKIEQRHLVRCGELRSMVTGKLLVALANSWQGRQANEDCNKPLISQIPNIKSARSLPLNGIETVRKRLLISRATISQYT
jgi:hypothetical protein